MDQRRDGNRKRDNFYSPYKRPKNNETNRIQNFRNFIKLDESNALVYIHPSSSYNKPWPEIGRPMEIGILLSEKRLLEIEKNENKKLDFEKTGGIKFLALPKICENLSFDLKIGLEKFVHHIPHQNGIDQLLKWILSNKEKVTQENKTKPLKLDFVCWRGLLTTMSVSAYDKFKDWKFSIILHKGTYYLCEIETDSQREQRINPDQMTKSFTYWGHKFETYISSDFPGDDGCGPDEVADPDNNFSTIVSNSIGNHKLMYGAEVDCCLTEKHKELRDYCEIKTSRGDSISDLNFERNQKFLKWWLQSYLVGIELIKVGLRNDNGIISKIIDCKVSDLLAPNRWWKENICLNLMTEILDSIKKFCTEENHVYIASREMNSNLVRISKLTRNSEEFEKNYFLRDWFKDSLKPNSKTNTNEQQHEKWINKSNITKHQDHNKTQKKTIQDEKLKVQVKKKIETKKSEDTIKQANQQTGQNNKQIQGQEGRTIPQIKEKESAEKINMTSEQTNLMQQKLKVQVKKKIETKKSEDTIKQANQQTGQNNKQIQGQEGRTIPQIKEKESTEKINMTSEQTNLMQQKLKVQVKKKKKTKKSEDTIKQANQQTGQNNKQIQGQEGRTIPQIKEKESTEKINMTSEQTNLMQQKLKVQVKKKKKTKKSEDTIKQANQQTGQNNKQIQGQQGRTFPQNKEKESAEKINMTSEQTNLMQQKLKDKVKKKKKTKKSEDTIKQANQQTGQNNKQIQGQQGRTFPQNKEKESAEKINMTSEQTNLMQQKLKVQVKKKIETKKSEDTIKQANQQTGQNNKQIQGQEGRTIPQIKEKESAEKINMTSEQTNLMQQKLKVQVKKKIETKKSEDTIKQANQQTGQNNKQIQGQQGRTFPQNKEKESLEKR